MREWSAKEQRKQLWYLSSSHLQEDKAATVVLGSGLPQSTGVLTERPQPEGRKDRGRILAVVLLDSEIHAEDPIMLLHTFFSRVQKATMLMLAGIVVLHITTIILLLVATIDNAWWITDTVSTDLWGRWELTNSAWHYTTLKNYPEEFLQAVQATSVLACIFAILALFVFVAQLFTLPKGQRFTFTGVLQLIACLCIMIAASIYTAELHTNETEGGYGHSYVLAWISFVLTFILAITYLVLRKKSE